MKSVIIGTTILLSFLIGYISTTGTKSQYVRLGDVFILGPFLIWVALTQLQNSKTQMYIKILLLFFGASTISYNLKNYLFQS